MLMVMTVASTNNNWQYDAHFDRGFVHWITCTAEDWIRHADAILAAQPVRVVKLNSNVLLDHSMIEAHSARVWIRGRQEVEIIEAYPFVVAPNAPQTREERRHRIVLTHVVLVEKLLAKKWPGITFELPDSNLYRFFTATEHNMDDVLREYGEPTDGR